MGYQINRRIEIDAGHRIPTHGSKCRNLHGHRYAIMATCQSNYLIEEGIQTGMVLDFGFLKKLMVDVIDAFYDHSMILWIKDPYVGDYILDADEYDRAEVLIELHTRARLDTKLGECTFINCIPTAENLAKHWFDQLQARVREASIRNAELESVTVFETPNCHATYPNECKGR